jgi:hypothetical protein
MLKLTFTYKGRQWQLEGEDQQIINFLSSFPEGTLELGAQTETSFDPPRLQSHSRTPHKSTAKTAMIEQPLRSDEEVKQYLLSRPDYNHVLFEVQQHFFKRTFTSRGEESRMYHRTIRQLREVRQAIAKERHGEFREVKGNIRGQKRYVFEPLPSISIAP